MVIFLCSTAPCAFFYTSVYLINTAVVVFICSYNILDYAFDDAVMEMIGVSCFNIFV